MPRFTHEKNFWYEWARTGGDLRHCIERQAQDKADFANRSRAESFPPASARTNMAPSSSKPLKPTGRQRMNGNVPNTHLIENLPVGCCVEVPCLVDANGIQPTHVPHYPTQLAALNRTNINVQELIVDAALPW